MTLWESSELNKCDTCGKMCKVWSPSKAYGRGESTLESVIGDNPYIDPGFKDYEETCTKCRSEDLNFRFRVNATEFRDERGMSIPKWIWHSD